MATEFLASLILLSLLSFSSSLSTQRILNATQVLSNSGYQAMALTLEFGSQFILPPSPSLTIFSPPDTAFAQSGQPSMSLLLYHISVLSLPLHSLKSLPPGTKIPTLYANRSLTVTSSPSDGSVVSLNGVKINGSALYDDGSLLVYGIEKFINPDDEDSSSRNGGRSPRQTLGCSVKDDGVRYSFKEANGVLRSRGCSLMASFLDLQLTGFKDNTKLTIFAPADTEMKEFMGDFSEYRSIFLRHMVPCKISWSDLVDLGDGVMLPTYLEGFMIGTTKYGRSLLLNGVQVVAPEMYSNSWLVLHGLGGSFVGPDPWHTRRSDAEKVNVAFNVKKLLTAFSLLVLYHSVNSG